MPESGLLREVVSVFRHSDTGTDGYQSPRYTRSPAGGIWYAQKLQRSAREQQTGGQMQQVVTTQFVFRIGAASALSPDGLIRHGSTWYSITGVREQMRGDAYDRASVTVDAVQVSDEPDPEDVVE